MTNDNIEKLKSCERCENDVKETFMCERCELMICDNCQASFNQFTQIDYNCCKSCASFNNE